MSPLVLQQLGEVCTNRDHGEHQLQGPGDDSALQQVFRALIARDPAARYTEAIQGAINYVLDGRRTGRFDLLSPEVHPGERAAVGAKLEYEVIHAFGLRKMAPLDTNIQGTPVDIKATIGSNWAIPKEAHCQLCLCTRIDLRKNRHKTWLIRVHRSWLHLKGNQDGKRGIAASARDLYAVGLYEWTQLPVHPLRLLTEEQAQEVLSSQSGQEQRMLKMFCYLPGVVMHRSVLETIGSGNDDPMRRARAVKDKAAAQGVTVLCGKWEKDRNEALRSGVELGKEEWVSLNSTSVATIHLPAAARNLGRPDDGS